MTHKPPKALKPFPWTCHHCFKDEVVMGTTSYDAQVRHDGRLHTFTIPELRLPICRACGEKVFTEKVDDQIGDALRAHLHLLFPGEMRAALDRMNMTQKEASERLGIAEATFSRWLTNTQIQSRALDNLLRVFFEFAEVREVLRGFHQGPALGAMVPSVPTSPESDPPVPVGEGIQRRFPHLRLRFEEEKGRAKRFKLAG
jgi:hypothetical protein